jgi:hypothetical protein
MDAPYRRILGKKECWELAEWVEAQEKGLAILVEASKREKFFVPAIAAEGSRAVLGSHFVPGDIALGTRALQMRANFSMAAGKFVEARRDAAAALRLGRLLRLSHLDSGAFMGRVVEHRMLQQYRVWAASGLLTAAQAGELQQDIQSLPEIPKTDDTVRYYILDWAMQIKRGRAADLLMIMFATFDAKNAPVGNIGETDVNILLRAANKYIEEFEAIDQLPTFRQQREALIARTKRAQKSNVPQLPASGLFENILTAAATGEVPDEIIPKKDSAVEYLKRRAGESVEAYSERVGMLFFEQPVDGVALAMTDTRAWFQITQIALALAAYHADNKTYPEKLAALSPKYLKQIPLDVYTDAEPIYRKADNGFLLYSIGANLKDDAANGPKDKKGADDLVVQVKKEDMLIPAAPL